MALESFSQKDSMGVCLTPDIPPSYVGGEIALRRYIASNLKIPKNDISESLDAKVNLRLIIDTVGNISFVEKIKSSGSSASLDDNAKKTVQNMPKWNPAMLNGKKVNSYYRMPIKYKVASNYNNGGRSKAEVSYEKGVAFYEKGNNEEALQCFLKTLELDKEHLDALYNCGAIYYKQKDNLTACSYWKQIRELGYNDAELLIYKHCSR